MKWTVVVHMQTFTPESYVALVVVYRISNCSMKDQHFLEMQEINPGLHFWVALLIIKQYINTLRCLDNDKAYFF